jgi:hypothetical protein
MCANQILNRGGVDDIRMTIATLRAVALDFWIFLLDLS